MKHMKAYYLATEQFDMIELLCEDWRTPEERLGLAIIYRKYDLVEQFLRDGTLLTTAYFLDAIHTGHLWIIEHALAQGLFDRSKNEDAMDRMRDVVRYGTVRMADMVLNYEDIDLNIYDDFRVSLLGYSLLRWDSRLNLNMTKYLLSQGADDTLKPFSALSNYDTQGYLRHIIRTEESVGLAISLECLPREWRTKYCKIYFYIVVYL